MKAAAAAPVDGDDADDDGDTTAQHPSPWRRRDAAHADKQPKIGLRENRNGDADDLLLV